MSVYFTHEDGKGNIVEQVTDNGDGTGTRTVYNEAGQVVSTGAVTGLPIPDPTDVAARTIEDRLRAALEGAKCQHVECEDDPFYSCPALGQWEERGTECDCGAEDHNKRIDAALRGETQP